MPQGASNQKGQLTILYLERHVEELAWERHGGPAGFAEQLAIKLHEYKVQNGGSDRGFRYPHSSRRGGRLDLRFFPFDQYVGMSGTLKRAKDNLPAWLWCAANVALDEAYGPPVFGPDGCDGRRVPLMAHLIQHHTSLYPARPPVGTFIPSDLLRVIYEAPVLPYSAQWGQDVAGLTFINNPTDAHYEWNETYLERLFTQLNKAMEASSVDWDTARWCVYDAYSQRLGRGLRLHPAERCWSDNARDWPDKARHWLYPYRYEPDSSEMRDSPRGRCPAGQRFNMLLPAPAATTGRLA
ncbi:hypothetical protein C8Q78DRAFT_846560 [Trametes maxima]|nr:hypothetical protein C8Q78DRAFT_846560 [Trametes maxima]